MAKQYDKEFKLYAIKMAVEDGKKVAEVARELDLVHQTLHRWISAYKEDQGDSFVGSGNLSPDNKKEGLIHHSDRGSQYAATDYQAILRSYGITTSMSRKGNCYDNACIESFHSLTRKSLYFMKSTKHAKQSKKAYLLLL